MRVVQVKKKGKKNASVETDTGIRVRVPIELGKAGQELDENRIGALDGCGSHRYLSLASSKYKRRVIDYSAVSAGQWDTFLSLSKTCMKKFAQKGWVRQFEFDEVYDEFLSSATDSGTPYRMWRRPKEVGVEGYVYAVVRGWLIDRFQEKAKERKRSVSFEYLESMNAI